MKIVPAIAAGIVVLCLFGLFVTNPSRVALTQWLQDNARHEAQGVGEGEVAAAMMAMMASLPFEVSNYQLWTVFTLRDPTGQTQFACNVVGVAGRFYPSSVDAGGGPVSCGSIAMLPTARAPSRSVIDRAQ